MPGWEGRKHSSIYVQVKTSMFILETFYLMNSVSSISLVIIKFIEEDEG